MRLQKLNNFRYSNQLGNKHYYPSVRISLRLSSNETAACAPPVRLVRALKAVLLEDSL